MIEYKKVMFAVDHNGNRTHVEHLSIGNHHVNSVCVCNLPDISATFGRDMVRVGGVSITPRSFVAALYGMADNGFKIAAIKLARGVMGIGLKEAKEFVEAIVVLNGDLS